MRNVFSCHLVIHLVAVLVLVGLDSAETRVTWELVQPKLPPSQAPATSSKQTSEASPQDQSHGSPWPVSTVEVSPFKIRCVNVFKLGRRHTTGGGQQLFEQIYELNMISFVQQTAHIHV